MYGGLFLLPVFIETLNEAILERNREISTPVGKLSIQEDGSVLLRPLADQVVENNTNYL